jgi:hypothetical protein
VRAAALIERLQKASRKLAINMRSSTLETSWQEDVHKMSCILDCGKRFGEQRVEGILAPSSHPRLDNRETEITQVVYGECNRQTGNLTWDQATRKQEKAVMKLVDTMKSK